MDIWDRRDAESSSEIVAAVRNVPRSAMLTPSTYTSKLGSPPNLGAPPLATAPVPVDKILNGYRRRARTIRTASVSLLGRQRLESS